MEFDPSDPDIRSRIHDPRFLGGLSLPQLLELQAELPTDKNGTVRIERSRRENMVNELRIYMPAVPETPEYDITAGPEGYIETVRNYNLASPGISRNQVTRLGSEHRQLYNWASLYMRQHPFELLNPDTDGESLRARDFLVSNLLFLTAGRAEAYDVFSATRNRVLRSHFPGAVFNGGREAMIDSLATLPVMPEQVAPIKAELEQIPYKTPYPDFFQIPDYQEEIVNAIGYEWRQLYRILRRYSDNPLPGRLTECAPLAYLGVNNLRTAIQENPSIPPLQVCRAFLTQPREFHNVVGLLRQNAQAEADFRSQHAAVEEQAERIKALYALPPNQQEIYALANDPEVNLDLVKAPLGEAVAITKPDVPIMNSRFDDIVDKHIQLLGRTAYERMDRRNAGLRLNRWKNVSAGALLRAEYPEKRGQKKKTGFLGNMLNLQITKFPVTQETLDHFFGHLNEGELPTVDDAYDLAIYAEMKSSGRPAIGSLVRLLVAVHRIPGSYDRLYKRVIEPPTIAEAALQSMRSEAANVSRTVAMYNAAQRPAQGGTASPR